MKWKGKGKEAAVIAYFKALVLRKATKILYQEGWHLEQAPNTLLQIIKHDI
jgi:hypothetical protein